MIERDLYFAAYCIENGMGYNVENGRVSLDADSSAIDQMRSEYKSKYKKNFDRVKSLVKELQKQRQESSHVSHSSKNNILIEW